MWGPLVKMPQPPPPIFVMRAGVRECDSNTGDLVGLVNT